MASSNSTGVEIVIQLESSNIHSRSTDAVQRTQEDELTSETQSCKKRKIKVSDE